MANEIVPPEVEKKVKGPAIGLIVTGALGALAAVARLVAQIAFPEYMRQSMEGMDPRVARYAEAGGYVWMLVWLASCVFILIGGLKMRRLENWLFALLANIVAIIPCFGCCCLGVPIGIWGLIVLQDEKVKDAFKK